jgi:enoyl-CoA hydratase/carnithine racemase
MPDGQAEAPRLLRQDAGGGVAALLLNRPTRRNALSLALLGDLMETLEAIAADASVRAVVLAAAGPAFCAGHDLGEIEAHRNDADGGRGFYAAAMAACSAVMQAVVVLPQPVIAAVHGVATAAGCQLAASCDIVVAEAAARFCTPGVAIGLFCSTPAVALARAAPRHAALDMLLTGDMVDAAAAQRMGLVSRVVPDGTARDSALAIAAGIAGRSAHAVRLGKRVFREQYGQELGTAYGIAAAAMVDNLMAHDAAEGIGAFLAKRAPRWEDR